MQQHYHTNISSLVILLFFGGARCALLRIIFSRAQNREAFDTVDEVTKTTTSTPCVFYHLTEKGCLQGDMCTYSHEPISTAHKEGIRFRLKHRKCPTLSRGEECHFGDDCLFA